ncbi:uncharacterized protein K452DRAFT_348435 [Aplosporella prunicola CBS 121167]|uniref:Mitochondrial carrier n=1 Tax=Aplosporella prunicola CBS 121167 TaxID=1176127 RepID=A0A6A6BTL5_9PEZI|nr:uncharacterized protein K452DRAFT_348435 [Aplosporella prunicola CBS 121167]KAF2146723.1 hypothetical protein K452DRAFT_348435 [Aplosporella prunicola CBS 121167]
MAYSERPTATITDPNIMAVPDTAARDALADQGKEALKDIVFGSVAGIAGKFIEYPFDTVKVRLQSQPDHIQLYRGPLDCFQKSWAKDGVMGLYRGISAPLFGAAIENSSLFFSYRLFQDMLQASFYPAKQPLPFSALLFCGAASGSFTSCLLTPIELIKCKMQVPMEMADGRVTRPGPLALIASVYRHQGIAGFWHGQLGTLIRETGGGVAWFGGYEGMGILFRNMHKDKPANEPLPIHQQMTCGAMAGMSYNFFFYPADTIKSRMQTEDVSLGGKRSFWSVGKLIWQQQGLKGMYRGCGITVCRSAPSSAFIFTIYEALKQQFANATHTGTSHTPAGTGKKCQRNAAAERVALDPRYHELLTLVKGVRNGIVYGTKVRFPHALVMIFLFRSGTLRQKASLVFKATRTHARNLGLFCLVYKASMLALRHTAPHGKERHYDAFLAGLAGGYTVFGRGIQSSVNQQIVIYVFARVVLAYAKLLVQPRGDFHGHGRERGAPGGGGGGGWGVVSDPVLAAKVKENAWPVFASLSWAAVMYVFRWHPETVQPSLRSSMHYIYEQSDYWDSLKTLLWHNK